ncbi:hypothetical protein ABPG74_020005 [Tetrahymena malaccensis]
MDRQKNNYREANSQKQLINDRLSILADQLKDNLSIADNLSQFKEVQLLIEKLKYLTDKKFSSDQNKQNDQTDDSNIQNTIQKFQEPLINLVQKMDFRTDVLQSNKQSIKDGINQKDLYSFQLILNQLMYLSKHYQYENNSNFTQVNQDSQGQSVQAITESKSNDKKQAKQDEVSQQQNKLDRNSKSDQTTTQSSTKTSEGQSDQKSTVQGSTSYLNNSQTKDENGPQDSQKPFEETKKNTNKQEQQFAPTQSKSNQKAETNNSLQQRSNEQNVVNQSENPSQQSTQITQGQSSQSSTGQGSASFQDQSQQQQSSTSKRQEQLTQIASNQQQQIHEQTKRDMKNQNKSQQEQPFAPTDKKQKEEKNDFISVVDKSYKIISSQQKAEQKLNESLNQIQQNWSTVVQSQNPAIVEPKQRVHSRYQSAQPYSPNLINQGFIEINNPQQFKDNEIEYIANQNQRMYYKITMRNEFTICSQFCDPDEQGNGFRNPDPQYDFCIPHNKVILAANNYLYYSSNGKKGLVNMKFTLHNRIRQEDSYQERELKKYQEFKSILESNIPISCINRNHPNDYFVSQSSQKMSEEVINILKNSVQETQKEVQEDDKIKQDNMNFLLKIYHKKRINEQSWSQHVYDLKGIYKVNCQPSDQKQINNIANIFAKGENIQNICKEIHGSKNNLKDLRYIISDKKIHSQFMNDIIYTINNQQIQSQEIDYTDQLLRMNVSQLIDRIKSSNGYFSYDESKVCEIFYELTCQVYGNELQQEIKQYNYLPIQLLKSSGYEQKWLVIDLKANQTKLNEYDSDEDIDKEDQKNKSTVLKNQNNEGDNIKKFKVLSIYTKEFNAQFSKHKQAVIEIKGSQKCAYNIDSTTIATNYYQLSLEKMRNLELNDQELIQVFYLALKELQSVFKNGFHFLSLNPKNIFLHIKATGSQKFKVKFHIDSSCYKPTQYYNPTFSPGLINQNWTPYSYDDISYFKKQTLYSLCLSFLHIITKNEDDIYDLDPDTIFEKGGKNSLKLKEKYPIFSKYLEIILIYGSTDDVGTLINLIKKDYINQQSRSKQKDFSILLHNKNNMQKVIDIQINKFIKVIQEFFTPRRIYERIMFFYYTNQFQKLNSKGEAEQIYLYVDQLLRSLNKQEDIVKTCPPNLYINQVTICLTKILFYQFKEKDVLEQYEKIKTLDSSHFTETQLCRALIGKQTVKFYTIQQQQNRTTCQWRNFEITEEILKKNLANKFIIQILKEKPRNCEKYAQEDVPCKIKLKLNERRFSDVQSLIDEYYNQREKYRKNIFFTPIKLSYYDDMINCRIGIKKMIEAFLFTNENFELKLNLFGWESVESANGCNSVGYVLFYLRKIKESQSYVEQAIFWSVAYKGTDNAELATSYNNIAYLVVNNNEIENSLRYHYKALKIRKQLHPKGHNDLGSTYNNIGQNLTRLKKNNESLQYYQKAINVWIRLMGYKHNTVSLALSNIANTYTQMQKYDHSIIFHRISYSVRYQTLKQESIDAGQLNQTSNYVQINNHDLAITLDNIGFAYTKQEKYEEALKVQELAKKMWKELCSKNSTHLQSFIVSLNNLGNTHKKMKNYDKCFQETYDTQKILRDCKDNNLVKQQQNVIRSIKNEINRHVIMTLREINCYLQVNQSEQAIVLLFKIAHLYDKILSQIQIVDEINNNLGLDDKINLQQIGIITQQQIEGINKIFPYIIFNKQPNFIRIPPRCHYSSKIDQNEKQIEDEFKILQSQYEQVCQSQQHIQTETLRQIQKFEQTQTDTETKKHSLLAKRNELIKSRQDQSNNEFIRIQTKFSSLHQFIMVLLLFSIGDILFEKIITRLKDQEFQKQSKEIFTELKYIIDAHITGDFGRIFNNYRSAFERRQ